MCSVCVKMIILAVSLLALVAPSRQALESPCPDILSYDGDGGWTGHPARWYGTITMPRGGHWLFMNIVLDTKADLLGNWLGDVSTLDNTVFRIENPEIKTRRAPIKFFVKHDPEETPPKIQLITVDGREICNVNKPPVSEAPVIPQTQVTQHPIYAAPPASDRPNTNDYANFRIPINFYSNNGPVQCGTVKQNNPVALVVDGSPTLEGQWPWQVALYRTEWVNHNYICGGTLVSHQHVITAAHCTTVKGSRPAQKVSENTLTIYLGKHDLATSITGVQIRFVDKITVHPEYDTRTYSRDVSVLQLQEPVLYSNWVQPACLWPDNLADLNNIIDKKGSVVGWGNDGSGKLTLVEMPVVTQETCLRSKGDFFVSVTSDFTYCAGQRNGQSACNGDSGGGMVFRMNGSWFLRGLVSIAPAKENQNVCDPFHYVVFTDLAKFLPWIRQNIVPY